MCDRIEMEDAESGGREVRRVLDPLYPLLPETLEKIREKIAERAALEGRDIEEQDFYSVALETICGAVDDSQPVEQYDGTLGVPRAFVDAHQAAVGQIQWNDNLAALYSNPGNVSGARWCSGTMITNDLFLTAGHCFDQTGGGWERPRINGTNTIIPSSEIATNMRVNFNYQVDPSGNLRPEQSFPITALIEYRLGGLDFAIVRLGGNPGATFGRTRLSATDAAAGDMVCIIGHPAGQPKRIEAGPALAPSGDQIRYDDIDTLGGNSGSGVLRASDGRIVGVHTNGGCTAASPSGGGANFGMRIASVIAASPTLQALVRPTSPVLDAAITNVTSDLLGTPAARDLMATTTIRDRTTTTVISDLGTAVTRDLTGTHKALDDVKHPALDKSPSDDIFKLPGEGVFTPPGAVVINPALGGIGALRERPFALAIPHHTMAWSGEGAGEGALAHYEITLAHLREDIEQLQAALKLAAEQYEALIEAYQAAGGQVEAPSQE